MASLNVALINEFQILRKYKLSILACTVDQKYTDNAILGQDVLDGVWTKPNWKNPKIALYDDLLENLHQDFRNIPKTSVEFDTWSSAIFTKHGVKQKPKFKTQELEQLWDLTHGVKAEDVGLKHTQVARLWRKFVKEALENLPNT